MAQPVGEPEDRPRPASETVAVAGPEEIVPAAEVDAHEPSGAEVESADVSAELRGAEEVAAEQVTALLSTVLDRLGAAHHRPFSRG